MPAYATVSLPFRNRLYDPHDGYSHHAAAVSADNGKTWSALGTSPSQLELQRWKVDEEFVPDYRADHWWYRTIATPDKIPMLEQSKDDGKSWTAVGQTGRTTSAGVLLAVNARQPGHLCGSDFDFAADHMVLLSSEDGGLSWNVGKVPASFAPNATSGEYVGDLLMDGQGNCYQGYHFGRGGPPGSDSTGSYVTVFRLPAAGGTMQLLPALGTNTYGNADRFVYVPGGNGMPAHLIAQAFFASRSWTVVFRGLPGDVMQLYSTDVP
jgi:hypothetical protein